MWFINAYNVREQAGSSTFIWSMFTLRQNAECMFLEKYFATHGLRYSYTALIAVLSVEPPLCGKHFHGKLFSQFCLHVLFYLHYRGYAALKTNKRLVYRRHIHVRWRSEVSVRPRALVRRAALRERSRRLPHGCRSASCHLSERTSLLHAQPPERAARRRRDISEKRGWYQFSADPSERINNSTKWPLSDYCDPFANSERSGERGLRRIWHPIYRIAVIWHFDGIQPIRAGLEKGLQTNVRVSDRSRPFITCIVRLRRSGKRNRFTAHSHCTSGSTLFTLCTFCNILF